MHHFVNASVSRHELAHGDTHRPPAPEFVKAMVHGHVGLHTDLQEMPAHSGQPIATCVYAYADLGF
jgi:hypothetical protein